MARVRLGAALLVVLLAVAWSQAAYAKARPGGVHPSGTVDRIAFVFYYPWYTGNPTYTHWSTTSDIQPSINIDSTTYPQLNAYDTATELAQHMAWIKQAGLDVVIISWWGQTSPENLISGAVLDAAQAQGLKVSFMIEPYDQATADSIASDIQYIDTTYGSHPAYFRVNRQTKYGPNPVPAGGRGVFFLYTPPNGDWTTILGNLHSSAVDPLVVMRLDDSNMNTAPTAQAEIDTFHADGLFNYGQYTRFTAYHNPLPPISSDYVSMFAASPGFDNSRKVGAINPPAPTLRNAGAYYDNSFSPLAYQKPEWVSVDSFNEWSETTQIEPAKPFAYVNIGNPTLNFTYGDYTGAYGLADPAAQMAYINRTAYWLAIYRSAGRTPVSPAPAPSGSPRPRP